MRRSRPVNFMRRVHGLEAKRRRCVSHERHLIAEFSATASSRLNAGVRHHSCHDNFNAELLELEVEVRCWRAGDDLFFASIGHFGEGLKAALAANRPPERHVLLDADSVNFVDTSACDALTNVIKELQKPRHHLRLRPCA